MSRWRPIHLLREREKWQEIARTVPRACCDAHVSPASFPSPETRMRLRIRCPCGCWYYWRIYVSIVVLKYVAMTAVTVVAMVGDDDRSW